ncbi:hypothetical protein AUC70_12055 [Methyloceanibacter stevinii]|uniref:Uncharacterized protein n=1 Tax=Methyloceanibacter stevinii TaxID=1774970 RepID=A0A1E3VJ95_9HYPH|nr:hypothetical protein [Methyloceanibacter stevinii]ODR93582.1 hypothetical protein AUC70_12055 [Methyloceanibacter stevinii]
MRHPSAWLPLALIVLLAAPLAWAADETDETAPSASEGTPDTGAAADAESNDPDESTDAPEPEAADAASEEDATPSEDETAIPDAPVLGPQVSSKIELTPEEKAEKEARKACKIEICDIIATREPMGEDIACDIKKTWRAESLTKMLGDQFSWPWGRAVCQSKLNLSRADLAGAMLESNATIKMEKFAVSCELHTGEGEPYVVEAELAPEVTFRGGKAVSASINWGDVSAPLMIYPILYAGTGLDNRSNLLGSEVVEMVNEFTQKKCAEVKVELPGRRVN